MLDRRQIIRAAITAAAIAASSPLAAQTRRKPPRLQQDDTVGLVEPAGYSEGPEAMAAVAATVAGMGLVPRFGAHVAARYGYLAGDDHQRAADLNAMYADDDVRAVFAVRGGWGSARILPLLDWRTIAANPKLLIGFSDVTALHLAFAARAGFPTIHGANAASSWPQRSWDSLWRLAFAGERPVLETGGATLVGGTARGRLMGGNLTVLTTLLGTPFMPDLAGAILVLEDVGEAEYRIDRMLTQLSLAGILDRVAGVVFGSCTGCTAQVFDYAGFTIADLQRHHLASLGVPVVTGADIGHIEGQLSVPLGCEAELDAEARTIRMLESPVA